MISFKELKEIASKLEIIEEMKEPLQILIADISKQGHSWMENISRDKTYQQMKEQLECEITEFLRRCFCIANNGQERFSEPALSKEQMNQASNYVSVSVASTGCAEVKEHEQIIGEMEKLTADVTSNSELLKTLQQNIQNQKKTVVKQKQNTNTKFEKIMEEFYRVSDFMSKMSEDLKQTQEQIQDKKIQEVSPTLVSYLELRDSSAKKKEKVEHLEKERNKLTEELEKAMDEIKSKDFDILQFKEEQVAAREILSNRYCEISQLRTETEKRKESVEHLEKEMNRLTEELEESIKEIHARDAEIFELKAKQDFNNEMLTTKESEISKLKSEKDYLQDSLRLMNQSNTILHNEYDQALTGLETKESEIVKLKQENALANEAFKNKDKEIIKLIQVKDFKRCVEEAIKRARGLDYKGVVAFWSGVSAYRICRGDATKLSREDCIKYFYKVKLTIFLTSTERISNLKIKITDLLIYLGLGQSEQDVFWNMYTKLQIFSW